MGGLFEKIIADTVLHYFILCSHPTANTELRSFDLLWLMKRYQICERRITL